jgi:hypothetical protein
MPATIIRFADYEQRSKNPDAVHRDPSDSALIILLPVIRIERYEHRVDLSHIRLGEA